MYRGSVSALLDDAILSASINKQSNLRADRIQTCGPAIKFKLVIETLKCMHVVEEVGEGRHLTNVVMG